MISPSLSSFDPKFLNQSLFLFSCEPLYDAGSDRRRHSLLCKQQTQGRQREDRNWCSRALAEIASSFCFKIRRGPKQLAKVVGINQRNIYRNRIWEDLVFLLSCDQKYSKKQDRVRNPIKRNCERVCTPHYQVPRRHSRWISSLERFDWMVRWQRRGSGNHQNSKTETPCYVHGIRSQSLCIHQPIHNHV